MAPSLVPLPTSPYLLPSLPELAKIYEAALERTTLPTPSFVKEYGSLVGSLIYPVPCSLTA